LGKEGNLAALENTNRAAKICPTGAGNRGEKPAPKATIVPGRGKNEIENPQAVGGGGGVVRAARQEKAVMRRGDDAADTDETTACAKKKKSATKPADDARAKRH